MQQTLLELGHVAFHRVCLPLSALSVRRRSKEPVAHPDANAHACNPDKEDHHRPGWHVAAAVIKCEGADGAGCRHECERAHKVEIGSHEIVREIGYAVGPGADQKLLP